MSDKGKNMSMWLRFFRDAGIPSGFDTKYALVFDENRIKMDMLMDINKECLRDMGITAMGDIISIVKHAKHVHDEYKTQAYEIPKPTSSTVTVSKNTSYVEENSPPPPSSGSSSSSSGSGGPRNVIINHNLMGSSSTSNSPKDGLIVAKPLAIRMSSAKASGQLGSLGQSRITIQSGIRSLKAQQVCDSTEGEGTKNTILRLKRTVSPVAPVQKEEVPFQKKIRVPKEQEGKYRIIMPAGTTLKTQKLIQDRLGPSINPAASGGEKKSSVFNRLGGSSTSDVRVSSSTEVKPRPTISKTPEDNSTKVKSSVFSRLGQGKVSEPLSLLPAVASAEGSDFLKTRFTVKQAITSDANKISRPAPVTPVVIRLPPKSEVHREKTLTTIHSSISRSFELERTRDSSFDQRTLGNVSSSSSSTTRVKLSMDEKQSDSAGVKLRLGTRRQESSSRSRSRSPVMKSRLVTRKPESSSRSRSPPSTMKSRLGARQQESRSRSPLPIIKSRLGARTPQSRSRSRSPHPAPRSRLGTRRQEDRSRSRSPPPKPRMATNTRQLAKSNSVISAVKGAVRQPTKQFVAPMNRSTGGPAFGKRSRAKAKVDPRVEADRAYLRNLQLSLENRYGEQGKSPKKGEEREASSSSTNSVGRTSTERTKQRRV